MSDADPIDLDSLEELVREGGNDYLERVENGEIVFALIEQARRLQKAREAWTRLGPVAPVRILHPSSCAALNGRPLVYTPCDCGVDALRAALEGP